MTTCSLRHTFLITSSFVKSDAFSFIIRPLLEYVSPVWYLHSAKDIDWLINWKQFRNVLATCWVYGSKWNTHIHNLTKSFASVFRISTGAHLIPGNPISCIVQVHDILHKQVSIPFDYKCRDSNTRSHPLSSSSIMLIGIHSPFLWNLNWYHMECFKLPNQLHFGWHFIIFF